MQIASLYIRFCRNTCGVSCLYCSISMPPQVCDTVFSKLTRKERLLRPYVENVSLVISTGEDKLGSAESSTLILKLCQDWLLQRTLQA